MAAGRRFADIVWSAGDSAHAAQSDKKRAHISRIPVLRQPRHGQDLHGQDEFARALNCLDPHDGEPCGECAACRDEQTGASMDVLEIDAASNNVLVRQIRDLRDKIMYPPAIGKYRVYIIDEVHMLSAGAFNALLKTLEEPPAHAVFTAGHDSSRRNCPRRSVAPSAVRLPPHTRRGDCGAPASHTGHDEHFGCARGAGADRSGG